MKPGELHFHLHAGRKFTRPLQFYVGEGADAEPIDLTGWDARCQFRARREHTTEAPLLDLTVGDGLTIAANVVTVEILAADTTALGRKATKAVHDFVLIPPAGAEHQEVWLKGDVVVHPPVTQ